MEAEKESKRAAKKPRGIISVVLLLAALALSARVLLPDTVGEHVRRVSVKVLEDIYPGCKFKVRSGRYEPGKGLVLSDIEIRDGSLPSNALPLLTVHRLLIETRIQLDQLRSGTKAVKAEKIVLDGVTVNAWELENNRWSPELLVPQEQLGNGCPLVVANGVRVRLCRSPLGDGGTLELNDIQFSLAEQRDASGQRANHLIAKGSGGLLESFQLEGIRDFDGRIRARGTLSKASFDQRAFIRLPDSLQSKLKDIANASAMADVQWQIEGTKDNPLAKWLVGVNLHSGRFQHDRLPVTAERLSGKLSVSPRGVMIDSIIGEVDGAKCEISGTIAGLSWPSDARLKVKADQLLLSDSLLSILPEKPREVCEKIRPSGVIDFEGYLTHHQLKWNCDAVFQCQDINVNIDKFPYPLEGVRGTVYLKENVTRAENLVCKVGQSTIRTSFQLSPQDSDQAHWIELASDQPVLIDETLIAALTPRGEETTGLEKLVRSLSPGGYVRLIKARLDRQTNGEMSKQFDLEVTDGRLRYDGFSYPLYEVRGRIWVDDRGVRLSQFQAQNTGGAQVQCEGAWVPYNHQPGGELDLTFRAYSILLDQGLRAALPAAARQTWDTLAPSGTLERLEVNVRHNPSMTTPELSVTAEQWGNPALVRKELSVTPTALPYRLDISRGIVRMVGDQITISELDGYHGMSRLTAEGQCLRRSDGRWQLDLNVLTGSRLRPDHDLISALPDEIRGSFAKLQLREPVSLRGTTQLILPDPQNPLPIFSWNMLLQLEGNRIADAGPVHDIRGEIAVRGTASGDSAVADGSVRIDSMHVHDLQLVNIRGPFVIRGSELRLGAPAERAPADREGSGETPITGNVFDGEIRLVGDVLLSTGAFDVDMSLERANLASLLAEMGHSNVEGTAPSNPSASSGLQGLFGGKVRLEGNLGASNLLRGNGKAALTNARMYQLPVLMQVFNQLRLKPAEDVAFTDGTTNFSIDGDLLTLTDLTLWGDLVALSGGGTINGRKELDLAFNTQVSPQNAWSRLVRPLSSSKYTLWTISVSGLISQPKIEGRALEAVGETLETLFPLIEKRTDSLPLATGTDDLGSNSSGARSADRRLPPPKSGGSPWSR